MDERERAIYEENLKRYRDWRGAIKYAVNEGMERGFDKGIKQGKAEGIEQGKAEGLEEATRQFIFNMKREGLDDISIARIAGMNLEEVQKILG